MESPVKSVSQDFRVEWMDPEDATYSWLLDDAHYCHPMPLLTQEVFAAIMGRVGRRTAYLNGYAFALNRGPTMPGPELEGRDVFEVWRNEYRRRVVDACAAIRNADYETQSGGELAAGLEALFAHVAETHYLTMSVVQGFLAPTMRLIEFCHAELGEEGGTLAATILQGEANETSTAGAALSDLAATARGLPEVAQRLRDGRLDRLSEAEGGSVFLRQLQEYLHAYGRRAETWAVMHVPTWSEDPTVPLRLVARYLDDPTHDPAAAMERASGQREEALAEVEKRLSADKIAHFRELVQASRAHVPMSEERTFCQLLIWGSLRVPLLALGRKLVEAGVIQDANDVFFLSSGEARAAFEAEAVDMSAEVEARKADIEAWRRLTPPLHVGAPAAARTLNESQKLFVRHFRGPDYRIDQDARLIKGQGASRGVVRARARVLRSLAEAERLRPGDVLVCTTTSAPWTPLFAIAGAVVTDAGGILAHSAISAREYGIPCVVGTSTATRLIPDGAFVTVDGVAGTVAVEPEDREHASA